MKYRERLEKEQVIALKQLRNQVDNNQKKFIDIILKRGLSPSNKQKIVIKKMVKALGEVKNNSYISNQEYIPNSKKWLKKEEARIRKKRNW